MNLMNNFNIYNNTHLINFLRKLIQKPIARHVLIVFHVAEHLTVQLPRDRVQLICITIFENCVCHLIGYPRLHG